MNNFNTLMKRHGFEPIEETGQTVDRELLENKITRLEREYGIEPDNLGKEEGNENV